MDSNLIAESQESNIGSSSSSGIHSDAPPLDNNPFANEMLKYIKGLLMEEDLEKKTCMLQDCFALQAAEISFYEVLGHYYNLTQSRSTGRKNYEREDVEEGRINKQSALSLEDSEQLQSKMFDDVLLAKRIKGSNGGGITRWKKKAQKKSEVVDLWSLLTQSAQSVAIKDQRTANELLKQISQFWRLACYFADALKTRLAVMGEPLYSHLLGNSTLAADVLKAYGLCNLACAFKKINLYANKMIMEMAEKATTLHIVDYGICYGFQWLCLIQRRLAALYYRYRVSATRFPTCRKGGRVRVSIEQVIVRDSMFEYNVIAKKWKAIQLEELKIKKYVVLHSPIFSSFILPYFFNLLILCIS
ncbi:scarecrow-like protein 14 [Hibiscus syriacus]|uniref:scarecrow-like protein 14 n=1 Tax=Hibiscus syriacus TaxID=106335 RepID=UPI001921F09D|nr:scarecrow-like protein 14 [Hibiscus syriacus]